MTTSSRNVFKHLKICYKTKTNREHDFQEQKKRLNIPFSCLFFIFEQNFKQKKRLVMTCVFECFQSHCHILNELHDVLCMMGVLTIFGKGNFIFSFVGYGLVTKSLEVRCTFEEVANEKKCQKMNVNIFTTKLERIISHSF
jgi:hypothetical protein